jgi:hypothetical protein
MAGMNKKKRLIKVCLYCSIVILISLILISGCSAKTESNLPGKADITATSESVNPGEGQSTTENSSSTDASLLGDQLTLSEYTLAIPANWYYAEVNRTNLHGWIFTSQDPIVTRESGFVGWAGAFWAVTPLPAGTSAEEITKSLQSQNFNSSDLSALLIAPEQAGVFDLSDAEVELKHAEITTWAGQPCIKIDGTVSFTGIQGVVLDTTVFLMSHNLNFISYYQFSDYAVTGQIDTIFAASINSLALEQ